MITNKAEKYMRRFRGDERFYALHPTPYTLHPIPCTLSRYVATRAFIEYIFNPQPALASPLSPVRVRPLKTRL